MLSSNIIIEAWQSESSYIFPSRTCNCKSVLNIINTHSRFNLLCLIAIKVIFNKCKTVKNNFYRNTVVDYQSEMIWLMNYQ